MGNGYAAGVQLRAIKDLWVNHLLSGCRKCNSGKSLCGTGKMLSVDKTAVLMRRDNVRVKPSRKMIKPTGGYYYDDG